MKTIKHRTKTALAFLFIVATMFGAACLTLDMVDQAAARQEIRHAHR